MIRLAADLLATAGAVGCWWFVISYQVLTGGDWRRTAVGRHLFSFTANLGMILTLITVARFWPAYPGRQLIVVFTFGVLVGQVWYRVILLYRAQREQVPREGVNNHEVR